MRSPWGSHYAILPPAEAQAVRDSNLPIKVLDAEHGAETLAILQKLAETARPDSGAPSLPDDTPVIPDGDDTPIIPDGPVADFRPTHPAFHVPFPQKGDQVVGRADALAEVRKKLTGGQRTSIGQAAGVNGLGGLGKTQLAVEYAYAYRDAYPSGVVWITADQEVEPQLIEAAVASRWVSPQSDHKSKLDIALHRVRTFDGGLVVFDNVVDRADVEPYLPVGDAAPHLLLTSRTPVPGFPPVDLHTLGPDDAYRMLVLEADREPADADDEAAARAIVARLDGLPLALELAGAYLRYRTAATFAGYLELLEEGVTRALGRGDLDSFTDHDKDVASALAVHDALIDEAPALPAVLAVLTWSASAAMGRALLATLLPDVSGGDLREALDLGVSLRLLRRVPDAERYAVHRLVAEVRREQGAPDAAWATATARALADWFEERREEFEHLDAYEADLDHLTEWAARVERHDPSLAARLTWLQAYPAYHRSQPSVVLERIHHAYELLSASPEDHPELRAHLLHDEAYSIHEMGEYDRSLQLFRESLAIRRAVLPSRHPETAHSLANIGTTLHTLGRYEESLQLKNEALLIRKDIFPDGHPDIARSLYGVGATLYAIGRREKAMELLRDVLEIQRAAHKEPHPDLAASLLGVGATLFTLGRFADALELEREALAIDRAALGEDHPEVARCRDSMSSTLVELGRYPEALQLANDALAARRSALGEDHPDVARSLVSVGAVLISLGKPEESVRYLQQAVGQFDPSLGPVHPATLYAVCLLADAHSHLNQAEQGLALVEKRLSGIDESHPLYQRVKDSRDGLERQVLRARRSRRKQ